MASRSAKMPKMKKTKEHLYDAQGAPEAGEAMDETPGMHKGGKVKKHAKRKDGGHVEGKKEHHRADKKARGGMHHKRASGGRTPYTTGHMTTEPAESKKTDSGHEGQRPSSGA